MKQETELESLGRQIVQESAFIDRARDVLATTVIGQGAAFPYPAWALGVAVFGAVVSLYFYLNVVRTVFWSSTSESVAPIRISHATRWAVYLVVFAILWLGILPGAILNLAEYAVHSMGL